MIKLINKSEEKQIGDLKYDLNKEDLERPKRFLRTSENNRDRRYKLSQLEQE